MIRISSSTVPGSTSIFFAAISALLLGRLARATHGCLDRLVVLAGHRGDLAVVEAGFGEDDLRPPRFGTVIEPVFAIGSQHGKDAGECFVGVETKGLSILGGRHENSR